MKKILVKRLYTYIKDNNPDLLLRLEESATLRLYLHNKIKAVEDLVHRLQEEGQPDHSIEQILLDELTKELKPSKFNYIKNIIETEFTFKYKLLQASGTLVYEGVNLIAYCTELFESFEFNKGNAGNKKLKHAVTSAIGEYFDNNF